MAFPRHLQETATRGRISTKSDHVYQTFFTIKAIKMAFSKANRYEVECQILNHFFRSISHPARQKIIKKLCRDEPCEVKKLAKNHPISRSTFSEHLKLLREAQMISAREEYPFTYYTLNKARLLAAKKIIKKYFDSLDLE